MPVSFSNLLGYLNIFRNINFERDIIGRYAPAFVPRGENFNQPSYYSSAANNAYVNAAGNLAGGANPWAGWLTQGIGTGLLAAAQSANPYIGIAAGGAALLGGVPNLISGVKEKKTQKAQNEHFELLNSVAQNQKDLSERYSNMEAELKATREALQALRASNRNNEISVEQNKEAQQISKEINEQISSTNPVKQYNNLQIQRAASFTISALPPVVQKRQVPTRTAVDLLTRRSGIGNFFAPV